MFLRPIEFVSAEDRAKLKPQVGDVVMYEGVRYVAEEVGMKYLNMHLESNPSVKGFAKLQLVYKVLPEMAGEVKEEYPFEFGKTQATEQKIPS